MTPYFNDIETYVNNAFTDALGFDALFRTNFTLFLDNEIVQLVDPVKPYNEIIVAITTAIKDHSPNNYALAVGSFKLSLYQACEYVVNLVITANAGGGGTPPLYIVRGNISQAGVDPPVLNFQENTIGALVPLYNSPGNYTILAGLPRFGPSRQNINFLIQPNYNGPNTPVIYFQYVSDFEVLIHSFDISSSIGGGSLTYFPNNNLLLDCSFQLLVYA